MQVSTSITIARPINQQRVPWRNLRLCGNSEKLRAVLFFSRYIGLYMISIQTPGVSRPASFVRVLTATLCVCLLTACQSTPSSDSIATTGSVESGEYRNLFAEAGFSPAAIDEKIQQAFNQLFFGDPTEQAIYYEAGRNEQGPLGYILDVNSNDVRSEGMSYGMMIAVQLDQKALFDAIWNWSMTHMYHSDASHPAHGYFAWSVKTSGEPIDEMPAPDGEEYFATALYFAAARWGNGDGIYDYTARANKLLQDILHREPITGMTNRGEMTAINLFDIDAGMVRFTPDVVNAYHTDASYHLPAFYEIWARVGPPEDRNFWKRAAKISRDYLYQTAHPRTALTPDYGNFDGTPWAASWRPESADFRYDAWRTAMNWSMDWSWWAEDIRQVKLSNRLLEFFAAEGINDYVSLYSLDGKPLGDEQTTGHLAMNATAALAATTPVASQFVHALWNSEIPEGQYRYYDGVLYLMALLHASGRYQVWLP